MIDFPINTKLFSDSSDIYIVGGSLRNHLLNKPIFDYDIVVSANTEVYIHKLASDLQGRVVKIGKSNQGIIRIVTPKCIFDILPLNGQSIEEDLGKRDFTINAMAYHLSSGKIIDIFGGMQDLKDKKIRMVSRQAFRNDPIRLLRAYRMAATFGFKITKETAAMIEKEAGRIRYSAGERIREELIKIMQTEKSHLQIGQMAENRLLFELVPELKALRACTQNEHHSRDVFSHTLSAYDYLEQGLNTLNRDFPEWSHHIIQSCWGKRTALLKWAMLLHDVGKPAVQTKDLNGRIHFYHHSQKGAEIAKKINDSIRLSKMENRFIDTIIRHHTRPLS